MPITNIHGGPISGKESKAKILALKTRRPIIDIRSFDAIEQVIPTVPRETLANMTILTTDAAPAGFTRGDTDLALDILAVASRAGAEVIIASEHPVAIAAEIVLPANRQLLAA